MRNSVVWAAIVLFALLGACGSASAAVDLASLRPLPVQNNGRSKPIDTFAIETVRSVTGYANFGLVQDGDDGQKITGAMDSLAVILDWSSKSRAWERRPVLYVPLLELRQKLGMAASSKWISPLKYRNDLAIKQWTDGLLDRRDKASKENEETDFTKLEQAGLELYLRLRTYDALASSAPEIQVVVDPKNASHWFNISELSSPTPVIKNADALAIPAAWKAMVLNYSQDDDASFQSASALLNKEISSANKYGADQHSNMAREVAYNRIQPFRIVWIAYAISVIALITSNMWTRPIVYRLAMMIFSIAIVLHIGAFIWRSLITGWAPVTNMYETVIWVSLVSAVVAMGLELISKRRTAAMAGSIVALLIAIVADFMPPEYGSTIRNLTPVLRSNYWLFIHVLTIVSSYAAFALAMVLGDIALFQFWSSKSSPAITTNVQFIYRSVQVGVLLVAAGTILGGMWAAESWGRFWGWDPKEVWALIVLLTYLALLHGRFAGLIGQFGLAAGSVICFTTVLMSWYGVNFVLGTGLHSYGFNTGGQGYVVAFVLAQWIYAAVIWYFRARSVKTHGSGSVKMETITTMGLVQNADH